MSDIHQRELKMQEKRKKTPWREFVKEICSWYPLNLYKNSGFISRYPQTGREGLIVSKKQYEERRNDAEFGLNFSGNFFDDFFTLKKTFSKAPTTIFYGGNENNEYADAVFGARNVYLSFSTGTGSENVLYSFLTTGSKNVFGSVYTRKNSENIYESFGTINSYNIFFSKYINSCSNIRNSANMIGCQECLFCQNLTNQSYCIANKNYEKEEYFKLKKKFLSDKKNICQNKLNVKAANYNANAISGCGILNSSNAENCYFIDQLGEARNCIFVYGGEVLCKNFYDSIEGGNNSNDFYGVVCAGTGSNKLYNTSQTGNSQNIYYCYDLDTCSYCLGCVGLKNKSFCIFNKQYTKEERYEKANEIFQKMDADGELGQFFPGRMNPFYFNDTVAYLIDPSFTKEEVQKEGYLRRDEPIQVDIPAGVQTVETKDLSSFEGFDSEGNRSINEEILRKVIIDEAGNAYRVIPMELEFLQKHGLPLPRLHWLDRIKLGFQFA